MGVSAQLSRRVGPIGRRGLALPIALLGLVLVSVLAIAIHTMSGVQNTTIKNRESSTRAMMLAEAAVVHAAAVVRDTLRMYDYSRLLIGSDNVVNSADDGLLIGYGMSGTIAIPAAGKAAPGGSYTVQIVDDPADPDPSPGTDGNSRVLMRCTGTTSDNASAIIDVVIGAQTFPGIATDSDLEISGKPALLGPCGGIHTNGNMTGGGQPTVSTKATATGTVTVNVTPKADGQPKLEIPDLNPADYCASADFTISGNFVLSTATPSGTYCVLGNVTSSGDFGDMTSMKAISIIATGSIQINSKPFIKAAHPDGILLLAGGDFDLQGDWGGEGLLYAGGHCYVSSKPTINGQLVCKSKPDPPGAIDRTDQNLISGDARITFGCSGMFSRRRQLGWYQRIGA